MKYRVGVIWTYNNQLQYLIDYNFKTYDAYEYIKEKKQFTFNEVLISV